LLEIINDHSMKRFLMAAVSCAACLAPSAAMAVTAEITATGTIPAACNVEGASIAMNQVFFPNDGSFGLVGVATGLNVFGSANPIFTLSQPTVVRVGSKQNADSVSNNAFAEITVALDPVNPDAVLLVNSLTPAQGVSYQPLTPMGTESGSISVSITRRAQAQLIPGDYTVSATLSCFTD